jgi:predicted TIM-barrel fold metal-dependent hydrolase
LNDYVESANHHFKSLIDYFVDFGTNTWGEENRMATDWLVIDSHSHFLPAEAITQAKRDGFDLTRISSKGSARLKTMEDIEGLVRVMEDAGIDKVVLNQAAWNQIGIAVCKALNNGYAKIGRDYPGKFVLCGHAPLREGQDVLDEIERCVSELGFKAISMVCSLPDVNLDSPQLWPVYEKINELDVPIVVHPPIRQPLNAREKKYDLSPTIFREGDIAASVVEIMYGVFKDFPDLKFLMPHYGGGMPGQKARIRAWFEPEGWDVPDEIKNSPKSPKELDELGLSTAFDELFNKIYFDMAGQGAGWLPMMKIALLAFRPDRICFGTDYPFDVHSAPDFKLFIDNIKGLDIPENDRKMILGGNARRLFKFD